MPSRDLRDRAAETAGPSGVMSCRRSSCNAYEVGRALLPVLSPPDEGSQPRLQLQLIPQDPRPPESRGGPCNGARSAPRVGGPGLLMSMSDCVTVAGQ